MKCCTNGTNTTVIMIFFICMGHFKARKGKLICMAPFNYKPWCISHSSNVLYKGVNEK